MTRERCELRFDVAGFSYEPSIGAIYKDGKRRDYYCSDYGRVCNGGVRVLAHRLAWRLFYGSWPVSQIDHASRDCHDNRIDNLREATNGQNQFNKGAARNSKSGERGVYFDNSLARWRFAIQTNGKRLNLFASNKLSATLACRLMRRILHKEYACIVKFDPSENPYHTGETK